MSEGSRSSPRGGLIGKFVQRVAAGHLHDDTSSSGSERVPVPEAGRTHGRSHVLRRPTVGPIVGTSCAKEARIFLAAPQRQAEELYGEGNVLVAAADLKAVKNGTVFGPKTALISPDFDYTAVISFADLHPDTEYRLRAGWFYAKDKSGGRGKVSLNFKELERSKFRTAADNIKKERSFVFGSCRYLFKLHTRADISLFDSRGDKTFRSILRQMKDHNMRTDVLIMCGDQIYSDDIGPLHKDEEQHEYLARYRDAFSQPSIRQLMMQVPTSMILDDHEIENDFPANFDRKKMMTRYVSAMHAYQIYQASHSTIFRISKSTGAITDTPDKFWYTFSNGCCEWFVMDTRTERRLVDKDPRSPNNQIINQEQMDAVKEWLSTNSGRIKFVVTSVPMYPSVRGTNDKWSGFPRQRSELIEYICSREIPRVVFLSGDIHNSVSLELRSGDYRFFSVCSSAFFWPFPEYPASIFIREGSSKLDSGREIVVSWSSKVVSQNNFTRIEATPKGITAKVYSRKGELLCSTSFNFGV